MKINHYIFLYLLSLGVIFNACSSQNETALKVSKKIVCSKVQTLPFKIKKLSIDKIVTRIPKVKEKVILKKKKIIKKRVQVKKTLFIKVKQAVKVKKIIIVKPKKLIKKKKNIGDKVCRNGKGLLSFMALDLIGQVEKKQGDKIQVKIIASHSKDKPIYNGIGLYKNTMLWDKDHNWKICK